MKHLLPNLLLVFSVGVGAETISHTFSDGSKYVGEVKNGKMHGQGTYTYKNGDKSVGEYKDDKPWEATTYDKNGNVTTTYSEGVEKPVN